MAPDVVGTALGIAGQVIALGEPEEMKTDVGEVYSTVQFRVVSQGVQVLGLAGAGITVRTNLPGWRGNTVQEFYAETNNFGYAVFKLLPSAAYNYTVTKGGYRTEFGVGASPAPGQKEGNEVRMTPQGQGERLLAQVGNPLVILLGLAAVLAVMNRRVRGGITRGSGRGRGR